MQNVIQYLQEKPLPWKKSKSKYLVAQFLPSQNLGKEKQPRFFINKGCFRLGTADHKSKNYLQGISLTLSK